MSVIAVIDDDEAILVGLSSLLRSAGHQVLLYSSAEAFLKEMPVVPDCALTDVQMPRMNGLELQTELKRRHPGLPVIFMTAFPEAAVEQRAMQAGARGFLHKPFEAETILRMLAGACGNRS